MSGVQREAGSGGHSMEYATVLSFIPSKSGGYGFLERSGQSNLFFHVDNGRTLTEAGDFSDEIEERKPQEGEVLCFEIETGRRDLEAKPWAFAPKVSGG